MEAASAIFVYGISVLALGVALWGCLRRIRRPSDEKVLRTGPLRPGLATIRGTVEQIAWVPLRADDIPSLNPPWSTLELKLESGERLRVEAQHPDGNLGAMVTGGKLVEGRVV